MPTMPTAVLTNGFKFDFRRGRKGASRPVSRVLSMAVARHWMTIHLERPSPDASRDLPGRLGWKHPWARRPAPSLFGLAPGGVCHAAAVAGSAVRSCRTISPLRRGKPRSRYLFCGTVPGVAPAGRYPAPCFHGARTFLPRALSGLAAAVIRPAGGTTGRRWAGRGQMMVWRAVYGRDAIVSGAGTWGIALRRFRPPPGCCPLEGSRGWRGRCPARG